MDSETLIRKALRRFGYAKSVDIVKNEYGKPFLKDGALYFNVTHTDGLYAVAVGNTPVGLDAQRRNDKQYPTLKKRLRGGEQAEDFFELWTAKEAYVKFCGKSLASLLALLEYREGTIYENGVPVDATFYRFELEGCAVCLCTHTSEQIELILL